MRYTTNDANASDFPYFANNILDSHFVDCTVSVNGIEISTAKEHYAQKIVIETEFSHETDTKKIRLQCQCYENDENPGINPAATSDIRKKTVLKSAHITSNGKLAVDFFSCEKRLVSRVTLCISMSAGISRDASKHYKFKIDEANCLSEKWRCQKMLLKQLKQFY